MSADRTAGSAVAEAGLPDRPSRANAAAERNLPASRSDVSSATTIAAAVNPVAPPTVPAAPDSQFGSVAGAVDHLFDAAATWMGGLAVNGITDFLQGALLLLRRSPLFDWTIDYNLPGCVTSKDCSGADLTGVNFSGVDLNGVDLGGAQLTGAYFFGSELNGLDLSGADLTDANLDHARLVGANLTQANLFSSDLHGANLTDANLTDANLHDANLTDASLHGANLAGADFGGAAMTGADLGDTVGKQTITFSELDSPNSKIAVRVDTSQAMADAIKVDAGTAFTLTLPGPASEYKVIANKPSLVDTVLSGNQLQLTAKTPGFLGLNIQASDGSAERFVGLYIADPTTHVVPDTVAGYVPVGSVTVADQTGNQFLENFNFRDGVAPIDYLYIYDQGGADYTDGNLKGLLTQSLRYGTVPVVVFYNIQNVLNSAGQSTGVVEGPDAAYQSINDYNQSGQTMYAGYMQRYFTKLATDFSTMNRLGVPVQVVMEPDFLGYMKTAMPTFQASTFVPSTTDRTLNTALTSAIYDAGLLTPGTDPSFPNTLAGMVQAINYYTATEAPNVRIGWKTNIWSVSDQQNWSLGLLHMTDPTTYPWQSQWSGPATSWDLGRAFISAQATGLGTFLNKVGVMSWSGAADRTPFLAIDKYGVDGAYTYDPDMLTGNSQTAAFGNLSAFVTGAGLNVANLTDADSQKYFGLSKDAFAAFYAARQGVYPLTDPEVQAVFTAVQNAAKSDPNMALWFFNADHWNNYLLLVNSLSQALDGAKVMLWQIPQGHINGSTTLPGTDLSNVAANFEDSATSYFFGDSFTAPGGRLAYFAQNQAGDPGVSVSGNTVTWGEHLTLAQQSGVMSVLFGAGLGISTRGTPTPGGPVNDMNLWADKAAGYLSAAMQTE